MTAPRSLPPRILSNRLVLSLNAVKLCASRRLVTATWSQSATPHNVAGEPQGRRRGDRPKYPAAREVAAGRALPDILRLHGQYIACFLHFLPAVRNSRERVHTLLFGTHVCTTSRARFKAKDPDGALPRSGANVADLSRHAASRLAAAFQQALGAAGCSRKGLSCWLILTARARPDEPAGLRSLPLHRSSAADLLNPLLRSRLRGQGQGIAPWCARRRSVGRSIIG